jgi:hypothetical protein
MPTWGAGVITRSAFRVLALALGLAKNRKAITVARQALAVLKATKG